MGGGGGKRNKGVLRDSVRSVGADSAAKPPTTLVPLPPRALQGDKGSPQSAGAEGRKFKTSLLNLVLAPRPRHGDQHSAQAHPLRDRAARFLEIRPLSATVVSSHFDSGFPPPAPASPVGSKREARRETPHEESRESEVLLVSMRDKINPERCS